MSLLESLPAMHKNRKSKLNCYFKLIAESLFLYFHSMRIRWIQADFADCYALRGNVFKCIQVGSVGLIGMHRVNTVSRVDSRFGSGDHLDPLPAIRMHSGNNEFVNSCFACIGKQKMKSGAKRFTVQMTMCVNQVQVRDACFLAVETAG